MGFNTTRIITPSNIPARTAEGGQGFLRDAKMELYSLVVTSLLSGDTYYEKGEDRLARLQNLIKQVMGMKDGVEFLAGLAVYARDEMHMRSSPTMLSAELFINKVAGANQVAREVWMRGDEHLEALAYVKATGEKRPKQMLRAVAERLRRFDPYHAVKYACSNKTFTQRDALRLAHPMPSTPKQSALFKFITQGWDKLTTFEQSLLPEITKMKAGDSFTWEQQISTQGSTKETWELAIPKMGYMALLRNLRNFIDKDVSKSVIDAVCAKLSDENEVRRSKQFPYRFLNAYLAISKCKECYAKNALGKAIRKAVDYSVFNVPDLEGDSLILVDISGSMQSPLSTPKGPDQNGTDLMTVAAMMGAIISTKAQGETWAFGTSAERSVFGAGDDVFRRVEVIKSATTRLGWGTNIGSSLTQAFNAKKGGSYRRAICLTDMQAHDDTWNAVKAYRAKNPNFSMYVIDMQGYKVSCLPKGNGCYQLAGFSDRVFNWISEEEASHGSVISKITDIGKRVLSGTYQKPDRKKIVEDQEEEG